ncbi:MAG: ABC transporter permease [Acidimicrobiia bacterium]
MSRHTVNRRAGRRPPALALVLAAVALTTFLVVPLLGLLERAPWRELPSLLGEPEVRTALRLSVVCSLSATLLSVVLGVPLAWLLARTRFPGQSVVRALVLIPMVLPPVVGGVALLLAFGRRGLVGQWLDEWLDIRLPFTTPGVILAETFVAMPFLVVTVEAALRSLDPRYEEAGTTLGAGRWTVFRRVTLPMIGPSLAAGAALTWARALGEFGATITFAGNFEGRTQTMPLAVFLALQTNPPAAIALSLVLLAISVTVLAVVGARVLGGQREREATAAAVPL